MMTNLTLTALSSLTNATGTNPPPIEDQADEVDIIALTIWGEAASDGLLGMEAIASVIRNRYLISRQRKNHWWGTSFREICQARLQFQYWHNQTWPQQPAYRPCGDDQALACARRIAQRVANFFLQDSTDGATHFHHHRDFPDWARGQTPTAAIASHIFYRLTLQGQPQVWHGSCL